MAKAENIRKILAAFDDDALTALANKGLLRRARKDLEGNKGTVSIEEESAQEIVLNVDDFEVRIPENGPVDAVCSCPASGVCRHVVTAVLFFKAPAPEGESSDEKPPSRTEPVTSADVHRELMDLSLEQARKWAGKSKFNKGMLMLDDIIEIDDQSESKIAFSFPDKNVSVVMVNGAIPQGAILTGTADDNRQYVVATILHYQRKHGVEFEQVQKEEKEKSDVQHTIDLDLLVKVGQTLREMVHVGIAHLSTTYCDRLISLALTASGAKLARLSLALRSIEEELQLYLKRDAQARQEHFFGLLAGTYALTHALQASPVNPPRYLVGYQRSQYEKADETLLCSLGAYQWETKSGFHGVTMLLWEPQQKQWYTWSDARSKFHVTGFDPCRCYLDQGPWQSGVSIEKMTGKEYRIANLKSNHQMRLSNSAETAIRKSRDIKHTEIDFGQRLFTDWSALSEYGRQLQVTGLRQSMQNDDIVLIKPHQWDVRTYNRIQQEFYWFLKDREGRIIPLVVPFTDPNKNTIRTLEQLNLSRTGAEIVVGRLIFKQNSFQLYPISLFCRSAKKRIINLTLDSPKEAARSTVFDKLFNAFRRNENKNFDFGDDVTVDAQTESLLNELEDTLLACAEYGTASVTDHYRNRLADLKNNIEISAFELLAVKLAQILNGQEHAASLFLQSYYVCGLYRQVLAVSATE